MDKNLPTPPPCIPQTNLGYNLICMLGLVPAITLRAYKWAEQSSQAVHNRESLPPQDPQTWPSHKELWNSTSTLRGFFPPLKTCRQIHEQIIFHSGVPFGIPCLIASVFHEKKNMISCLDKVYLPFWPLMCLKQQIDGILLLWSSKVNQKKIQLLRRERQRELPPSNPDI